MRVIPTRHEKGMFTMSGQFAHGFSRRNHMDQSTSDYDISSTHPLSPGQALRELPIQYLKVLTRPSVKTFAEEKCKE
jgi:hypothetical protein